MYIRYALPCELLQEQPDIGYLLSSLHIPDGQAILFQIMPVILHTGPVEHQLLFVKPVLIEKQIFFHQNNLSGRLQGSNIAEKLMWKQEKNRFAHGKMREMVLKVRFIRGALTFRAGGSWCTQCA